MSTRLVEGGDDSGPENPPNSRPKSASDPTAATGSKAEFPAPTADHVKTADSGGGGGGESGAGLRSVAFNLGQSSELL